MSRSLDPSEPEPPSEPITTTSGLVPSTEDAKAKVIKIAQALSVVNNTDVRTQQGALEACRVREGHVKEQIDRQKKALSDTPDFRVATADTRTEGKSVRPPLLSQAWATLTIMTLIGGFVSLSIVSGSWLLKSGALTSTGNSLQMASAQVFALIGATVAIATVQDIFRSDEQRRRFRLCVFGLVVVLLTLFGITLAAYNGVHQFENSSDGDLPAFFPYLKSGLLSFLLLTHVGLEIAVAVSVKLSVMAIHTRNHPVSFEPNPVYKSRKQEVDRLLDEWELIGVRIAELESKALDHDLACAEDEQRAEAALKKAQQKRIAVITPVETDQSNVTPLKRIK